LPIWAGIEAGGRTDKPSPSRPVCVANS